MDKRYIKLIEIARALKPLRQELREFHVAGIFKKNKLISLGTNTLKTHPKTIGFYPSYQSENSTHAEAMACIRGKLENYSKHDLIVIRLDNRGLINYSKPCNGCMHFVNMLNFENIFYSNHNGEIIKL